MSVQAKTEIASANDIYVRRSRKLLVCDHRSKSNPAGEKYVASFVKNLESAGYTASEDLIKACSALSLDELTALNNEAMNSLRKARGAHRPFNPMYPNFPNQVMQMSDARLYLNAILHYFTDGRFFPATQKDARSPLDEQPKLQTIDLGNQQDFEKICTRLASSNTSISQQDKDDLAWFIARYGDDIARMLPEKIPNREVRAIICCRLLESTTVGKAMVLKICDTATDVLRLAVALSGGDVSLAEPVKFRQFSRSERRLLMEALAAQTNQTEDMLRWKERWKRLGERLHPGEYARKYPEVAKAFDVLRKDLPFQTFNSRLESALRDKDVPFILSVLKQRPGDLARRLDHLCRLAGSDHQQLVSTFAAVCGKISTPLLLQVRHHFASRNAQGNLRVFLPKGEVAKAQAIKNTLPPLDAPLCQSLQDACVKTLIERFKRLPRLGKCFIDPELRNYLIPFSQRSASKSLRTAARGSRLPLPSADTLRFFVWWKNGRGRTDLDLSAVMFNKDFGFVAAVTFYELKNFGGHHSGDIVDAPQGASEFIDMSRARCLERDVRYIVMVVNSYTTQPYCDLPECFAGWMGREKPDSGEIYEPKTVEDKLDISSNSKIAIPAIFDLQEKRVIWTDMSLTKWPYWYNTVAANLWGIQLTLRSLVELAKPNLYDLLQLHIDARGEFVSSEKDADTVFSVANGTPFDLAKIASDYMAT